MPRATWQMNDHSFFFFFFFALSCSTRDGYYYQGGNSRRHHLRIRAPLRQDRATAGPLPSGGCDQHRFLVDCSSPTSLPLVQPTSSRRRFVLPAETVACRNTHHTKARPVTSAVVLAMLCSSKGSDGRSEAMNATLLRLEAIARLISCRVTRCHLVSASRTAGRGRSGAIIRVSSRSTIQPCCPRECLDCLACLACLGRGSTGHRDFSGHGLWGHHISSQAHPPPLPGSPLAFPRALLHSLNKRTWQDGRCESDWETAQN